MVRFSHKSSERSDRRNKYLIVETNDITVFLIAHIDLPNDIGVTPLEHLICLFVGTGNTVEKSLVIPMHGTRLSSNVHRAYHNLIEVSHVHCISPCAQKVLNAIERVTAGFIAEPQMISNHVNLVLAVFQNVFYSLLQTLTNNAIFRKLHNLINQTPVFPDFRADYLVLYLTQLGFDFLRHCRVKSR